MKKQCFLGFYRCFGVSTTMLGGIGFGIFGGIPRFFREVNLFYGLVENGVFAYKARF